MNETVSSNTDIEILLTKLIGTWGVFAQNLTEPRTLPIMFNAKGCFPTASVIKVLILVELFNQVLSQKLTLQTTSHINPKFRTSGSGILTYLSDSVSLSIQDVAFLMMMVSDNTAANLLIDKLGRENINHTIQKMGLSQTILYMDRINPLVLKEHPEELAITTPYDISLIFTKLAREEILTPQLCQKILSFMKKEQNKWRICGELPMRPDILIYHKTGTLQGVFNDAGIVRSHKGQYVISIFSKDVPEEDNSDPRLPNQAEQTIARISRLIFDQFEQSE